MDYKDILNSSYFKETYSKIEELKKDFPVNHGFVHVNNVIKNAKRLAKTFNLDNRQEGQLLIASVLHDIGYLSGREDHALNGSFLAKEYLESNNFDEDDIKVVCEAIKNHGGKEKSDFDDPISMCLIIADKLDFVASRYKKENSKYEYTKTFLNVLDSFLSYKDNQLTLNIVVNNNFDISFFENSSYFNKLMLFFDLLSSKLNSKYNIEYEILK